MVSIIKNRSTLYALLTILVSLLLKVSDGGVLGSEVKDRPFFLQK